MPEKQQGRRQERKFGTWCRPFCGQLAEFGIEWCQVWQFGTLPWSNCEVWYLKTCTYEFLTWCFFGVEVPNCGFGRIRGTKLPILEEGRCHIADLVRERWIPVHRAVGLWLWSPCRRRQMDRRGRRAALPRGRVRCGSALCGAVGDRRARRDPQGGVARLRRLRVLAWAYLLHRRCRKAAAEDRSQTFENVNE